MVVIVWQLDLQLPMQSVHFESRSGRGLQHYVIKFVSDLRHVDGFVRVLRFSAPIKLTATILMKVALSTIKQTNKNADNLESKNFEGLLLTLLDPNK